MNQISASVRWVITGCQHGADVYDLTIEDGRSSRGT